ncbi:hypothetical protein M5K25_018476 [Dendrobium thyrsiflorum]|uniref:RRM domain-containing protein n=1 Tax=Dendrobium thyrsiflorum TaxID=117978 RepID=A0ABD0UJ38_DENTH
MNDAKRNVSASWKIIYHGADCLTDCIRWKVKDGKCINILNQVWVWDKAISDWPTFANVDRLEGMKVSQLMAPGGIWDKAKIVNLFWEILGEVICNILVQENDDEDGMELIKVPIGRSISSIVYEERFKMEEDLVDSIFKLKLNPRVRLFWWRVYGGIIPTADWLLRLGLQGSVGCPFGCRENEDLDHITVRCKQLNVVFSALLKWGFDLPNFRRLEELQMEIKRCRRQELFWAVLYCNSVFLCWKNRNDKKHGNVYPSPLVTVGNAVEMIHQRKSFSNSEHWDSIQPGGIGVVVRNSQGKLLLAASWSIVHWDSLQVELIAVQFIGKIVERWMFGMQGVLIEGDNASVIVHMQKFCRGRAIRQRIFVLSKLLEVIFCGILGFMSENLYIVEVSNLSPNATERDLYDFFSFSGVIEHIEIIRSGDYGSTGYVTFKEPHALETAVLLSSKVEEKEGFMSKERKEEEGVQVWLRVYDCRQSVSRSHVDRVRRGRRKMHARELCGTSGAGWRSCTEATSGWNRRNGARKLVHIARPGIIGGMAVQAWVVLERGVPSKHLGAVMRARAFREAQTDLAGAAWEQDECGCAWEQAHVVQTRGLEGSEAMAGRARVRDARSCTGGAAVGATIIDQQVCIARWGHNEESSSFWDQHSWRVDNNETMQAHEDHFTTTPIEAISMAQEVVKTMLAKGYVLGKDALSKAKALDESYQVSASAASKVADMSKRIGLTDKINAGVDAIYSIDERYHVMDTTKTVLSATGRTAAAVGNSIVNSSYFSAGALLVSDALSRAAKAAADLSERGARH